MTTNFQRLVIHIASQKAIPANGNFADGLNFLADKAKLSAGLKAAQDEANAYIDAIISTPDNPYGNDREAIAEEILRRVQKQSQE